MILALLVSLDLVTGTALAGCESDVECKGDRICTAGQCSEPTANAKTTSATPSTASAAPKESGCPWAGTQPPSVSTDMTTVTVNGTTYFVRGMRARLEFEEVLEKCGNVEAYEQFQEWRAARRGVNSYAMLAPIGLVSAVVVGSMYGDEAGIYPAALGVGSIIALPVLGVRAGSHRQKMEDAIRGTTDD